MGVANASTQGRECPVLSEKSHRSECTGLSLSLMQPPAAIVMHISQHAVSGIRVSTDGILRWNNAPIDMHQGKIFFLNRYTGPA